MKSTESQTRNQEDNYKAFRAVVLHLISYIAGGGSIDAALRILGHFAKEFAIDIETVREAAGSLLSKAHEIWLQNDLWIATENERPENLEKQIAEQLKLGRDDAIRMGLQIPFPRSDFRL